jgi:hypothetical protein
MSKANGTGMASAIRESIVVITGFTNSGEKVIMELPLRHEADVSDDMLIGQAVTIIRQSGGICQNSDQPGEIDFYPLVQLKKIHFAVNRIALVGITPTAHGPSLVQ